MELEKIKVYRMTHINNIPHILNHGITHRNSDHSNPNYTQIGDTSLISARTAKTVSVDNGETLNYAAPSIILGEYIPFYFGIKMPMLYVMQNGGNFVEKATPSQDIIYLACSLQQIINNNPTPTYYFSDGHATDSLTSFYDDTRINDLPSIVDWAAVKAPFWGGEENLNLKRKKQAEFLVKEDISSEHIIGYGCYNDDVQHKLLNIGVDGSKIKIIPKAYYD